jgi:hypothetical protein
VSAAGAGALGLEGGPVQESEAFVISGTAIAAGAAVAVGGSLAAGWLLRDQEILGSNPPASGLTSDAVRQGVEETAVTRKSTNASTLLDNKNIIDGFENRLYTAGKTAAIEAINAGKSESDVLSAAQSEISSQSVTVEKNLLKSWNESAREWQALYDRMEAHPDISDVFYALQVYDGGANSVNIESKSYTLSDGSSFSVKTVAPGSTELYTPIENTVTASDPHLLVVKSGVTIDSSVGQSDSVQYMYYQDWNNVWSKLQTAISNANNGLSTWVGNVYGQVQSGEIDISDLTTPSQRAATMSDEETKAQAIADLAALNISVDSQREAKISIDSTGAKISGTIALTDPNDGPIEAGKSYDPSTFGGVATITTDITTISGTWTDYKSGIDGGTITITSEPYEGMGLKVTTAADETVTIPSTEWTDNGDGTFSYDASGSLETTITSVSSMEYAATSTEPEYSTLQLEKPFTVESITNEETGTDVSSASFSRSEPQTDTNYITQEEWNSLEQQNKELIEKYEESQNTTGGGGGFLDGFGGSSNLGILAAGGAVLVYLLGNNN